MPNISIFKNSKADNPLGSITIEEFIKRIKEGFWERAVTAVRSKEGAAYKAAKALLPAVTVSGQYKTRSKRVPMDKRLVEHSGYICLDIDKKDNLKMRTTDLIDNQCLAQFVSPSGEGIKVIYKCSTTRDPAEHRRIYDAAVLRLQKLGITLKVDPIVKSIASLQYVSYDPDAFYLPKTKLVIKPLPAPKKEVKPPSANVERDLEELNVYIDALGSKDITGNYEDWLNIAFGLSYTLGEHGREAFHRISNNYKGYDKAECDEQYDACLERNVGEVGKPVTIASVFQIINSNLPKPKVKALTKKFNKSHAIPSDEEPQEAGEQQSDLAGMVRYRLFLFKKIVDKETHEVIDLVPHHINLNAFEKLLREKGFKRFGKLYVHIVNNIVETVDTGDILRIVTAHIEGDGDYAFTYQKIAFQFSWEELAHKWREVRGQSTTVNQIAASLEHWQPDLLKDTATESYIPYRNGIVVVNKKEIKLIPYASTRMQIWKERILPRDFTYTAKKGMYEEFFENICGRGASSKDRRSSEAFKRACWYFGYMLQGTKRQSTARAWLLYDIRSGNNGRTGKTIIGQAVGKIRSMVTLDGKQVDFKNRFAFQTVQPWTDVVFIDDPSKYMSIQPLFNMITGDLQADRKNIDPLVKAVKFMFASNWVLEAEGTSEAGRQFITQVDDFYVRWGKDHGNTITPIVDYHGKEFFTDWDAGDWSAFDSFAARCLQTHLKDAAPKNNIIGNSALVRFVQIHEQEFFFELASTFINNVVKLKEGGLAVPQGLMVNTVKDHDSRISSIQAGRNVREFFSAVGCKDVSVTSLMIANMPRMAYKLNCTWEQLQWGEYGKGLPKPKF